jgi:hypothetical protein
MGFGWSVTSKVNEEDHKISSNIIVDRRTNIVHAFLSR